MKSIPVQRQTIDSETGNVIDQRAIPMHMMPPAKDVCQVCATKHGPLEPHNQPSLYYQMAFYGALGRWPTWADATAHCDPHVAKQWRAALESLGHKWSRPPDGFLPVCDLGPEVA